MAPYFIFNLQGRPARLRSQAAQNRLQKKLTAIHEDIMFVDDGRNMWIEDTDPCGMQYSNSSRAMYARAIAVVREVIHA